jgi:sugar phosphate isomerase/epimerase
MHRIGFSTGALAFGDFRRGLELQRRDGVDAIELSALRESELRPLVNALTTLNLDDFAFRSFHAPSSLEKMSPGEVAKILLGVAQLGFVIIVHPDIIGNDLEPWRELGSNLFLENMDGRKSVCRTAQEMHLFFNELPEAKFCFDIGHARQVDPTMSGTVEFLLKFQNRLAEVHISEVNWQCKHRAISSTAAWAFRKMSALIPESVPVIIESVIAEDQIDHELGVVRKCLDRKDLGTGMRNLRKSAAGCTGDF